MASLPGALPADLRDAFVDGLIDTAPRFNSVSNYMVKPELTDILKSLITLRAIPDG